MNNSIVYEQALIASMAASALRQRPDALAPAKPRRRSLGGKRGLAVRPNLAIKVDV
jgi:hypothetical protein